ncbi:MAG TPA: hypothetical protein PKC43_09045 [Phycisphaerales bacterium]|nr:hypothetical protein [Phycisphaerales bacterium]HMP37581.1 hypothetical protein [Phycisphaerales bacterium]
MTRTSFLSSSLLAGAPKTLAAAALLLVGAGQLSATCSCVGDLDDNGVVDGADLGRLLALWGGPGVGDLNGDGVVDGADLGILLGAWGPCGGPANDNCANAIQIAAPSLIQFCTLTATTDGPGVAGMCGQVASQIQKDIWYTYFAPGSGILKLSTCNSADFDTIVAVYGATTPGANPCPSTDAPGLWTLVGCNDDTQGCAGFTSQLSVNVVAGNWYRIRLGGFLTAAGNGTLDVTFTSVGPSCENGIVVFGENGITKTVNGITTDNPDYPSPCAIGVQGGEWITYIPSCPNEQVFVSTCHPGTNFDTVIAVWRDSVVTGCTGELKLCVDDSPGAACEISGFPRKSSGHFFAQIDEIYHILVTGFSGAEGAYTLTIHTVCN